MEEKKEHKEFHIIVDQKPFDWPNQFISGAEVKEKAGIAPAEFAKYDVFLERPGADKDEQIQDDQKVDLSVRGTERFFTGKHHTTEG